MKKFACFFNSNFSLQILYFLICIEIISISSNTYATHNHQKGQQEIGKNLEPPYPDRKRKYIFNEDSFPYQKIRIFEDHTQSIDETSMDMQYASTSTPRHQKIYQSSSGFLDHANDLKYLNYILPYLFQAANYGNQYAQFKLARCYALGEMLTASESASIQWLKRATGRRMIAEGEYQYFLALTIFLDLVSISDLHQDYKYAFS